MADVSLQPLFTTLDYIERRMKNGTSELTRLFRSRDVVSDRLLKSSTSRTNRRMLTINPSREWFKVLDDAVFFLGLRRRSRRGSIYVGGKWQRVRRLSGYYIAEPNSFIAQSLCAQLNQLGLHVSEGCTSRLIVPVPVKIRQNFIIGKDLLVLLREPLCRFPSSSVFPPLKMERAAAELVGRQPRNFS